MKPWYVILLFFEPSFIIFQGLNKDEIYMGDEPDDEVPVDYSNQEEG